MKKLILYCFFYLATVCNLQSQVNDKELTGRWKFVKMEMPGSVGFDFDNLTESYKKFFKKQKQDVYHGVLTTNDSLYIQVQFEKLVNDVNRMFITFTSDKRYETNNYNKSGNMTEQTEKGTYFFNTETNVIYTYKNGNKKLAGRFKVIFLDKTKLVIIFDQSAKPAVFTCKKVSE